MSGTATDAATALGASQPPAVALGAYGPGMVAQDMAYVRQQQAKKQAETAPIYERMKADATADRAAYEKVAENYKPVEQTKPPPPPENDPLKGFASAAALFAGIASAFTHTPAINAMNGMAGAINAAKASDWKSYEANYKTWKDNTELAIQNHKLQAEDMKAALEKMQTDISTGVAMAKAVAAQSDDNIAAKLLQEGQYEKLSDHMRANAEAASRMQETALRIQSMMPDAIATKRLTAAMKSGNQDEIQSALLMRARIKDPEGFIAVDIEAKARAIAQDPTNYKDGKLTDDAFQKMMPFDPKLAMDVRKSGQEKAYAPASYRLPDGSNVTAIVSPDGTAREVGTGRVVNLQGAVKAGPETAAGAQERNIETIAKAKIAMLEKERGAQLAPEEKANIADDSTYLWNQTLA